MAERRPFVLLDDARESGAADALLFENPQRTFVAYRADQVADVLAAADAARREGIERPEESVRIERLAVRTGLTRLIRLSLLKGSIQEGFTLHDLIRDG